MPTDRIMPKSDSFRLEKALASPPGRVGLVILTVMDAAGALALTFGVSSRMPVVSLTGLVLTGLGLLSGITARFLLRRFTRTLRLVTALVGTLMGLLVFGLITGGALGLILTPEGFASSAWVGLLQVLWSGIVTWLAVQAWSRPVRLVDHAPRKVKESPAQRPGTWLPRLKLPRLRWFKPDFQKLLPWGNWLGTIKKIPGKFMALVSGLLAWPSQSLAVPEKRVKLNRARRTMTRVPDKLKLKSHPELIKLVGEEEHNCPYCLETVTKNDPRGLEICATCKTWHHADCWEVAGECQVPHQH
jgi:hypothetical protein